MSDKYYDIKDKCRKGLLKYLRRAISIIPKIENPKILDIGCGSGIPTLFIVERFGGKITAADPDPIPLNALREKVKKQNLSKTICLSSKSLFELEEDNSQFDLIFAEGLLNVVGFQKGFEKIVKLTKKKGFIIIHDEFPNQKEKLKIMKNNECELLDSFELNEHIWWNHYYKCLEKEIAIILDKNLLESFETDMLEINEYKKNPSEFKSFYYIIKRN